MAVKDHDKLYGSLPADQPNTVSRNLKTGDRAWGQVVYQSGKPVLDAELNLSQDLIEFADKLVGKHAQQSGFFRGQTRINEFEDLSFLKASDPNFRANAFWSTRMEALVAGFPLVVDFTETPTADENFVQLSPATTYNSGDPATVKRTDFVFLEVWQALVAPSPRASVDVTVVDSAQLQANDTVSINIPANIGGTGVATVYMAVAGAPANPGEFQIDAASEINTATSLVASINGQGAGAQQLQGAGASNSGLSVVSIKPDMPGVDGNVATVICVAANGAAAITPVILTQFTGGQDRPNKPQIGANGPVQNKLWRHGNVLSPEAAWLDDDIADPVIDSESTQRIQVQYRIRTTNSVEAVNYKSYPDGFSTSGGGSDVLAQGVTAAPVASYPFVPADDSTIRNNSSAPSYGALDDGLWVAGDGSPAAAAALGTVDGYCYAIPICFVFRYNETQGPALGFDPLNNTNGAPPSTHGGYNGAIGKAIPAGDSDRPDGGFCDEILGVKVLDLRRHVSPMGVDLKAEMQYQIQSLLDGTNRTWAVDTADKQTLGNGSGDVSTQYMICGEVGRSGAIDGSSPNQGDTPRGVFTRNFDHICRRFADQPVAERVVFCLYPGDRPIGGVPAQVGITSSDTGNPVVILTGVNHNFVTGDIVKIEGHSIAAMNEIWDVTVLTATTFSIPYDNSAGVNGVGGTVQGFGVENNGKYVAKTANSNDYRWHEGDKIVLDLNAFDASTTGGIFDGATWNSTAAFLANPSIKTFAPPGTVFTNVLSVYHDDGHYVNPMSQQVQPTVIQGMGTTYLEITLDGNNQLVTGGKPVEATNPERKVVAAIGDNPPEGSVRRIFVEVEISYGMGHGITDTPDVVLTPDPTVYAFGLAAQRSNAILENDITTRPADMEDPLGVWFRPGFREAQLEYIASQNGGGTVITDQIVSRNQTELVFPRRIYGLRNNTFTITDVPGGVTPTPDDANSPYGSSTRQMFIDQGAPHPALSGPGHTLCTVTYFAQDPIPNYGGSGRAYQLSAYYRSNAPQTAGVRNGDIIAGVQGGNLPALLVVEPLITTEQMWTGQVGMGSVSGAFPYVAPLDQIPIDDGTPFNPANFTAGSTEEWYFCATSEISVDDFDASTGLLALHTFVQQDGTGTLTLGGADNTRKPRKDAEFRAYYPFADDTTYRPTILSQPLSGAVRHKCFVPVLARATVDAKGVDGGILFRKNELVLVVLSRFAELDEENSVRFVDTNNRTCAAVYRTRNLLLTVGD